MELSIFDSKIFFEKLKNIIGSSIFNILQNNSIYINNITVGINLLNISDNQGKDDDLLINDFSQDVNIKSITDVKNKINQNISMNLSKLINLKIISSYQLIKNEILSINNIVQKVNKNFNLDENIINDLITINLNNDKYYNNLLNNKLKNFFNLNNDLISTDNFSSNNNFINMNLDETCKSFSSSYTNAYIRNRVDGNIIINDIKEKNNVNSYLKCLINTKIETEFTNFFIQNLKKNIINLTSGINNLSDDNKIILKKNFVKIIYNMIMNIKEENSEKKSNYMILKIYLPIFGIVFLIILIYLIYLLLK